MYKKNAIIFYLFTVQSFESTWSQSVVINEAMSKNFDSISDEDGDAPDWIEIYNPTDNDIDLGGYFLSDDANNLSMWEFPSGLVFPDDHLLVVYQYHLMM